jgi:hypothetical protein
MKCISCENDGRAICAFCGRCVCAKHLQTKEIYFGFGRKNKPGDTIWLSDTSDTGVIVTNAVWCGHCHVRYQQTY